MNPPSEVVTVIVASPFKCGVTKPVELTDATPGSDEDHETAMLDGVNAGSAAKTFAVN